MLSTRVLRTSQSSSSIGICICTHSPVDFRQRANMKKVQNFFANVTSNASAGSLPTARLGREGPEVNRLGYGCMGLVSRFPDFFNM